MGRHSGLVLVLLAVIVLIPGRVLAAGDGVTFPIKEFDIIGSTLIDDASLQRVLKPFVGAKRTADDVEKARKALESHFHGKGYPAVLVNIPEQVVEDGTIRLEVIESKIRRVRVVGNRYFTMEKILSQLPSIRPGAILYLPDVQEELAVANRSPDLKVAPLLMPGKELGTIDVELRVKDKLPLHGDVELNNRASHDTTHLRLNTSLRYDNLWQREHSLTLQYQTSPVNTNQVQAIAGSYVLPSPLNDDHVLAIYGLSSESDTALVQGFSVVGNGYVIGFRNVIPLAPIDRFTHNITLGVDYKNFEEELAFDEGDQEVVSTPITYWPFTIGYGAALSDGWGMTRFDTSINFVLREVASDTGQFEDKRFKSRGNYVYWTAGLERHQKAPWQSTLFTRVEGQLADQPLVANEQFVAGGMKSVRGYKESEASGDNAIRGTVELRTPDLEGALGVWKPFDVSLFGFYDFAALYINDPLPTEDENSFIAGTGAGLRGRVTDYLTYELVWGYALEETDRTKRGDNLWYFEVKLIF